MYGGTADVDSTNKNKHFFQINKIGMQHLD